VFIADVFFELCAALVCFYVDPAGRTPALDSLLCLVGLEAVDDVSQAKHSSRPHEAAEPDQRLCLPEVRKVMEGVAGIREIDGFAWLSHV